MQARLVPYGALGLLTLLTAVWALAIPVALLAIGFSGGELLSPSKLYADLVAGDPYWQNRAWAWFTVTWPFALSLAVVSIRKRGSDRFPS